MKTIAVLAFTQANERTQQYIKPLIEAGEKKGYKMIELYQPDLTFLHNKNQIEVYYQKKILKDIDAIIARPNIISEPSLHKCTIELLNQAGFKIVNNMSNFTRAKNKLDQKSTLTKEKIPTPDWGIVRNTEQAVFTAKNINFPVIVKCAFGSIGRGVFYAENTESLMPIVDYLSEGNNSPLIIEKFISEANRKDLRVFIIDGKIIASMERNARAGDVRANASIGGVGKPAVLSDLEKEISLKVARIFKLDIAGVDLIRSQKGPLVMEINSNPGFTELELATNIDVAGAIINFASSKIK